MSMDLEQLDELEPPNTDFRRVGRGVPMVRDESTGKMVRYRRSSSAGKILDDESGLTDWRIRTTVEGAAQRPDLMALASTLDHEANKRELRDIAEQCLVTGKGTQRQTTGTALHAMLDHVDRDDVWTPAPQFADAVRAYINVRDAYGLVPVDIECKCVNDVWRLAGTADRRYQTTRVLIAPDGTIVPIGTMLLGDTKTGRTLEYAHGTYSTQLAAYADSVRYDPVTDEREPFDPPTYSAWALIVHLDYETPDCTMHWVDLEAGRHGLRLAHEIYEWRRRTDLVTPARAPLHAVPGEAHTAGEDSSAPTMPDEAERAATGRTEAVPSTIGPDINAETREWLRDRIRAITEAGDAVTFHLQRIWPTGVPGLRVVGHTMEQLEAINEAVTIVEREHSLPFHSIDPRIPVASDTWAKGLPGTDAQRDELMRGIHNHPRKELLQRWSGLGMAKLDPAITDRTALTHALYEFALVNDEWSDDDLTEMLDGTLRAIGYDDGVTALGYVVPEDAPLVMGAAFALTTDSATLMYDVDGRPVVRVVST